MRFFIIILFIIILAYNSIFFQTNFALTVSQNSSEDWKKGKIQAVEILQKFDTENKLSLVPFLFRYELDYAVGFIYKKEGEEIGYALPTENNFFIECMISYPIKWKLDPFFSSSAKTQLIQSFRKYKDEKKPTAKFWDPITTQQSLGFAYDKKFDKSKILSRLGISLKQIRAEKHTKMTDDRTTKDITEAYKAETGIHYKTDFYCKLDSNLHYKTTLDMFGTFKDLEKWTVGWENELQIQVWKFFGVLLEIDIRYDENQFLRTQYKQSFRFGIVTRM